jgi:hypothetical protein
MMDETRLDVAAMENEFLIKLNGATDGKQNKLP